MRYLIPIVLLGAGIVAGVILPILVNETFGGAGVSLGSTTHAIPMAAVVWFLQALGMGFAAGAILCFVLFNHDSES